MATEHADIRLPASERGPLMVLLQRLGVAALLVLIVSVITYRAIGELRAGDRLVCLSSSA